MKSIFMKPVYKKEYYLNINYKLDYFVDFTLKHVNNIAIYETNSINKLYNTNKVISINDKIFTIDKIIEAIDKDAYVYIVKECEYIDDEESKKKAELDYENYLKIKTQEKEEEKIKESTINIVKLTDEQKKQLTFKNKKWWQFWK